MQLLIKKLKNIFLSKKFSSKLLFPKNYIQKNKKKIKNKYLTSDINQENMSFLYTFAKLLRIKDSSFINSMNSFKGLPHRFEIFLIKKNITFINDSKATTFRATQSALSSLRNIYWILEGYQKKVR